MSTKLTVGNISQYTQKSNHCTVDLNLVMLYVNYFSIKKKKKTPFYSSPFVCNPACPPLPSLCCLLPRVIKTNLHRLRGCKQELVLSAGSQMARGCGQGHAALPAPAGLLVGLAARVVLRRSRTAPAFALVFVQPLAIEYILLSFKGTSH